MSHFMVTSFCFCTQNWHSQIIALPSPCFGCLMWSQALLLSISNLLPYYRSSTHLFGSMLKLWLPRILIVWWRPYSRSIIMLPNIPVPRLRHKFGQLNVHSKGPRARLLGLFSRACYLIWFDLTNSLKANPYAQQHQLACQSKSN